MTSIPFLDLKAAYIELKPQLDAAYQRVAASGWYILGEEVEAFEREYAAYCGVRHCIGVANGLDAIHLLLRALDIGDGDDVIVPSHTYIASWLGVTMAGARPVPVEPDPPHLDEWNARRRTRLRDAVQSALAAAGIGTLIHYPVPPHLSGAHRHLGWTRGRFPIGEAMADTVLSLPIGPHAAPEVADRVADALAAAAPSAQRSLFA